MASLTEVLNDLLNPVIHQVIGSTPESLVKYMKDGNMKDSKENGYRLAAVSVFSAAVNKSTMETFLMQPDLAPVRVAIMNSFSVSGRTNMTALTLLGHCILTTSQVDSVRFVEEFRRKMGQRNLWDGELGNGSLSDKQKTIMAEKKRNINRDSAFIFGSGYWKFVGVNKEPWTQAEASFWGETITGSSYRSRSEFKPPETRGKSTDTTPPRPPRNAQLSDATSGMRFLTTSNGNTYQLAADVVDYYLAVNGGDIQQLERSVSNRGPVEWESRYRSAMEADPGRRGIGVGSVAG